MNRHQRRASKHQEKQKRPAADSPATRIFDPPSEPNAPVDFWAKVPVISDLDVNRIVVENDANIQTSKPPFPAGEKNRVSLLARLFSRVLLSDWILSRIENAEVEKLLISLAIETGREEVADKLVRRQALRVASDHR